MVHRNAKERQVTERLSNERSKIKEVFSIIFVCRKKRIVVSYIPQNKSNKLDEVTTDNKKPKIITFY